MESKFVIGVIVGFAGYWAFQHFSGKGNTGKSAGKRTGF